MRLYLASVVSDIRGNSARAYLTQQGVQKPTMARLTGVATATPNQLAWQDFFRVLDLKWQGFLLSTKEEWNSIGRRRKKIGYWVYMRYNLLYRKPPLIPLECPSLIGPEDPPI